MGRALLTNWASSPHINADFTVYKPSPLIPSLQNKDNVHYKPQVEMDNPPAYDIVIFCVSPQIMGDVIQQYKSLISPHTLIMTIAAGLRMEWYEDQISSSQPIIRTMPNTPVAVGHGMTIGYANKNVTPDMQKHAEMLFQATGKFEWMEEEEHINIATSICGSGPAYLFYFVESMTRAGIDIGLPEDISLRLATETVIGSCKLLEEDRESSIQTLRENVTSKGGGTEAALNVMMDGRWDDLFSEVLHAAKKRYAELAS